MATDKIGASPKRREDARFVTGHGEYLDDLTFAGLAHMVVLRSPHAHADLRAIDLAAAARAPGVLAVLTATEAAAAGLKPMRPYAEANLQTGEPFAFAPQSLLADGKVRFAGEPVAMIVAETKAQALDAAELIEVDYRPLPAVTTADAARASGAPQLSAEVPDNVCLDWKTGDWPGAQAVFAEAAHVVRLDLDNHRIVTNPMEPRGGVGIFDAASGRYTLHVSSQNIHINRTMWRARWARRQRTCASWRTMSVAASAPRTLPMSNMRWSCGRRGMSAVRSNGSPAAARCS